MRWRDGSNQYHSHAGTPKIDRRGWLMGIATQEKSYSVYRSKSCQTRIVRVIQAEQEIASIPGIMPGAPPRRTKVIQPPVLSASVLMEGLVSLYWYRDLLLTLSIHRVKVRYKQSVLGLGWAIMQPLSLMLVYTVIFSLFTRIPSDGLPYSLFVLGGLLPWIFVQTALSSSATGLVSHTQLISKVYFPREILPITYVVAALFDFLISGVLLGIMMAWYHVRIVPQILFVFPILAVACIFAIGVALFFSAAQVRYRDIGIAMPLLLQLWMFGTPVVYPYSQVPLRFRDFYLLNPLVGIVENFRRVVVLGLGPDMHTLTISAATSVLALLLGYVFFKNREATMADII